MTGLHVHAHDSSQVYYHAPLDPYAFRNKWYACFAYDATHVYVNMIIARNTWHDSLMCDMTRQHTAMHCNTQQHTATHCNTRLIHVRHDSVN